MAHKIFNIFTTVPFRPRRICPQTKPTYCGRRPKDHSEKIPSPIWLTEAFQFSPNDLLQQERLRFQNFLKMRGLRSVDCGGFQCSLEYHELSLVNL